ncbi:Fe-S cluster assembly protein SufD [Flaviflagellibacter deserti]|uniref:Fe-S cluster assembly protein SufD n=1 Tax=Flaviflagellibacter deserti TaxID=2267266 RepID=A0ABV9Z569_9HYPH
MNTAVRPIKTAAENALVEQFTAAKARLPGNRDAREKAFGAVVEGLPHRRVEEWKYTDLRALMRDAKPLADLPTDAQVAAVDRKRVLTSFDASKIVFANGSLIESLSDLGKLPAGVEAVSLAKAYASDLPLLARFGEAEAPEDNAAIALNTAFVSDGVLIRIAAGTKVDRPLHLAFGQDGEGHASYARILIVVEDDAKVEIVESHFGEGHHQTNSYVELLAGDRTDINLIKLQAESLDTQHLATLAIKLGAESSLQTVAVARGSDVARQQVFVKFEGDNTKASLNGISLSGARRHLDTTFFADHASYGCESRELFKSVLDGDSRSVFQGKILVRQNAQKTDGRMMSRALMLSEGSEADLKPELEIYADDVQCAHGATCGALDEDHLFYLMARGISKIDAQAILVEAFVGEVLDMVEDEGLKDALAVVTNSWLMARD